MFRERNVFTSVPALLLGLTVVGLVTPCAGQAQGPETYRNHHQVSVAALNQAWAVEAHELQCSKVFARKADAEGYSPVASLFRAAAASQNVHLRNIRLALKKQAQAPQPAATDCDAASTAENLRAAIVAHRRYDRTLFPDLLARVRQEGFRATIKALTDASETEPTLVSYYEDALSHLASGKSSGKDTYYVCSVCGYMTRSANFHVCKVCYHFREKHEAVS